MISIRRCAFSLYRVTWQTAAALHTIELTYRRQIGIYKPRIARQKEAILQAVVSSYPEKEQMETAVSRLHAAGFERNEIVVLTTDKVEEVSDILTGEAEETTAKAALMGTTLGGLGGLLTGIAVIPIPGLGPVVAGTIMSTASGSVMGGFLGAIFGSRAASQPQYDFKEELAQGRAVLLALAEDEAQVETAVEIARDLSANLIDQYSLDESEKDAL